MNNRNIKPISPFILYCQKVIPLAYDESMSYYECLCALTNYLYNEVIPAVNNNADAVTELQNAFINLKSYVDNYFENLDIQQEINNKLDEMAESGQLTDIIAQYLELAGILAFNTKANLKNADNLANGSFTKTYGEITYNDGKGEFYKIRTLTSSDVIDDDNILALVNYPTLIAEKMPNFRLNELETKTTEIEELLDAKIGYYVTPQMFGAIGDATHDDTQAFQDAINYIGNSERKLTLFVPYGLYKITDTLEVNYNEFSMIGIPRTEYLGRIIVNSANIDNGFVMMIIKGYGAVLENIEFREFNIQNNTPKATGVAFFRNTGTDEEDNANVDCDVTSCQFFDLAIGINGVGRNFDITECDFIRDEIGVKIDYNVNMEMRDINIFHCRFHAIGEWSGRANTSTCIQMPDTPNHTMQKISAITQNFADFIGTFIKGSGHGLTIQGNQLWDVKNNAIILIGDDVVTAMRTPLEIKDNVIIGARLTGVSVSGSPVMYHAIDLTNLRNVDITNNNITNSYQEPLIFNNVNGLNILNNTFIESPINPELMGLTVPTYSYMKFTGGTNTNVNGNSATPAYLNDNTTIATAYVISKSSGSIRMGANNMNRRYRFNEDSAFTNYSNFDNTSSHT